MAKKDEEIIDAGKVVNNVQTYVNENKNSLIVIAVVAVGIVGAYLWWTSGPDEAEIDREGAGMLWVAERYHEKSSFDSSIVALPMEQSIGFQKAAQDYDGSAGGNLANYYLGTAYLNKGEFELAIKHFKAVSFNDDMVGAVAVGATGDAYMELGSIQSAVESYEKAYKHSKNSYTCPIYMKKAAFAHMELGNFDAALDIYEAFLTDFPTHQDANLVKKLKGKAMYSTSAGE